MGFPAHNWPDPWLRDVHDSVQDGMLAVLEREQLLFVNQGQRVQQRTPFFPKADPARKIKSNNEPEVLADVL